MGMFHHNVELITGPYRIGKTLKLADYLLQRYPNPFVNALVIVPSHRYRSLFHARLLKVLQKRHLSMKNTETGASVGNGISKHDVSGLIGLKMLTFYETCEMILRQAGIAVRIASEHIRIALIKQILQKLEQRQRLPNLATISKLVGTHNAVLEIIDEFERAGFHPNEVLSRLERFTNTRSHHQELADIYREYWLELDKLGYVDQKQLPFLANEVLLNTTDLSIDLIAVDGFDRFNNLQLQVMKSLAKHTAQMKICFDYVPPNADTNQEYTWKQPSYDKLVKIFGEDLKQKILKEEYGPNESAAIVHKMQALDRFSEMDEIARRIKRSLIRKQTSADQILVVARDLTPYKEAIEAAFQQAGLNYYIDKAIYLNTLPVIQFLVRLLKLPLTDFSRLDVMLVLRSPYFNLAKLELTNRDVDLLDNCSLKACVVSGVNQWNELTDASPPAPLLRSATRLIKFFDKLRIGLHCNLFIDSVAWCEAIMDDWFRLPYEKETAPLEQWQDQRAIIEFKKLLAAIVQEELLLSPLNTLRLESNGYEAFLERIETNLNKANFRAVTNVENCITICSADMAPNRNFDEVYIAGMVEGEFPRRSNKSGFTNKEEETWWAVHGVEIHNPRTHPSFERALLSSLVKRARKSVHLSYPAYELNGEELIPSFLLFSHSNESLEPKFIEIFESSKYEPSSPRDLLAGYFWHNQAPDNVFRSRPDCIELIDSVSESLTMARGRTSGDSNSLYNGNLTDSVKAGILHVQTPAHWTVSQLSKYGCCPFQYWSTYVLQTQPHEEPEIGISKMTLGETYHKVLEVFYREMNSRNLKLSNCARETAEEIFELAINNAIKSLEEKSKIRKGEFWQYQINEIRYRLKRFFEKERQRAVVDRDGFYPVLLEASFGLPKTGNYAPLVVPQQDNSQEQILICGRIDRVDLAETVSTKDHKLLRVIDYKTGTTVITKEDALSGRNLQLPLYALAIEQSIHPHGEVTNGQYISFTSAEPIGRLSFKHTDEAGAQISLLDRTKLQVQEIIARIKQGDFCVNPNDIKVCKQCPHETICRIKELDLVADQENISKYETY